MTRREFVWTMAAAASSTPSAPLIVPVHRVTDAWAKCTPAQFHAFWSGIWPEAVRNFQRGGIQFQCTDGRGEIQRSPSGRPIFVGLRRGFVNLVLTDHIPRDWDSGRALAGVSAQYNGYHLCLIALQYAHGNQIPFLAVNTCVHELLHVLLQDIFVSRPKWVQANAREGRIDWYATRLWLFHDAAEIRRSTRTYLERLRAPQRFNS